jgi:hypothetical protein
MWRIESMCRYSSKARAKWPEPTIAEQLGAVLDRQLLHAGESHRIGGNRVVDMLSGEQLPRIC